MIRTSKNTEVSERGIVLGGHFKMHYKISALKTFAKFSGKRLRRSNFNVYTMVWWDPAKLTSKKNEKYVQSSAQQTFVLLKTFWRRHEDAFRLHLQRTSSSKQIYSPYSHVSRWRLQDVLKISWSRPIYWSWSYVLKTSWRRFFKTSWWRLAKTSPKRLQNIFKTPC